jgi:hypothetical protein
MLILLNALRIKPMNELNALGIPLLSDDLCALFCPGDLQAPSVGGWLLWPRILSGRI